MKNLDFQNSLSDHQISHEKFQLRLLLDVWDAAYYSQDLEIMKINIYKIPGHTIKNRICSEFSFGFTMYSMYLSKNGQHDRAYMSGTFALKIVENFNVKIRYPKITNLFCNYSGFSKQSQWYRVVDNMRYYL